MSNLDFAASLKKKQEEACEIIYSLMPIISGEQKTGIDAMNYAVRVGGKRLRPILMAETYKMFGGDFEKKTIKAFMAAQECIHTYSLIHDDLPAMDNDDYRRGKKTTHVVYGEANAILAGDGLLNYAFELTSNAVDYNEDNSLEILKAIQVMSQKSGIYGMVGGQVIDLETEGQKNSLETLRLIYRLKTSCLLESSMMVGAILGGASEEEVDKIRQIANKIGIAFQIQDDILDITSTAEELGKPIGSDAKNEKYTYASIVGIEEASKEVERLTKDAIAILDELPYEHQFLKDLLLSLINRRK